jgi:DNA-directed RNA polymerase specialized sigma24 family protein
MIGHYQGVIVDMYQQELSGSEGYDLFRRAILERDDDAWAAIYAHYRPLLLGWARHCAARAIADEQSEDIADRALARAWAALSPNRFAQFPNLAALLAYLRTCVTAAVIDAARAQATRERTAQQLKYDPVMTPEQVVLAATSQDELWRLVVGLVTTEHERVVLVESFVLDLPPRTILERHPDLFADVTAVYAAKRNLLNRLHRSRELQRLYDDLLAV